MANMGCVPVLPGRDIRFFDANHAVGIRRDPRATLTASPGVRHIVGLIGIGLPLQGYGPIGECDFLQYGWVNRKRHGTTRTDGRSFSPTESDRFSVGFLKDAEGLHAGGKGTPITLINFASARPKPTRPRRSGSSSRCKWRPFQQVGRNGLSDPEVLDTGFPKPRHGQRRGCLVLDQPWCRRRGGRQGSSALDTHRRPCDSTREEGRRITHLVSVIGKGDGFPEAVHDLRKYVMRRIQLNLGAIGEIGNESLVVPVTCVQHFISHFTLD